MFMEALKKGTRLPGTLCDAGDGESAIDFLADVLDDPDEPTTGNCSSRKDDDLKSYNETIAFLDEVSGRRNEEEEEEENSQIISLDTFKSHEKLPNKYHQPTWKTNVNKTLAANVSNVQAEKHVKVDSILGLRVINPKVSSQMIQQLMVGRKLFSISQARLFGPKTEPTVDWVLVGAIVNKSQPRTSKTGKAYSVWRISDLKPSLLTISVFLFSSAHSSNWKLSLGTVIGILNPKVMDNRDGFASETSLSVNLADKIMVVGTSKDYGLCQSRKKDGDACTAFVNLSESKVCVHHLAKEYKKSSRQFFTPNSSRLALQNKLLGNNEVFYGGKSFVKTAAKASPKQTAKDKAVLSRLFSSGHTPKQGPSPGGNVESNISGASQADKATEAKGNYFGEKNIRLISGIKDLVGTSKKMTQRQKDSNTLAALRSSDNASQSKSVGEKPVENQGNGLQKAFTLIEKYNFSSPLPDQNKRKSIDKNNYELEIEGGDNFLNAANQKSSGNPTSKLVFSTEKVGMRKLKGVQAKAKAIALVKKLGPVVKENPNKVPALKRLRDDSSEDAKSNSENSPKRVSKLDKFKELLDVGSKHNVLIEANDLQAQEEYFSNLERKEQIEEKMLSTYKIPCKGVQCLKCDYLALKASDWCKSQGHIIKVVSTFKRFFRCADCGNRTISLRLLPIHTCNKCNSSRWERTAMLQERRGPSLNNDLSIRGGEEIFIGNQTEGNLNLLVPE